jgi:hypothetical protein
MPPERVDIRVLRFHCLTKIFFATLADAFCRADLRFALVSWCVLFLGAFWIYFVQW